jgi:hypothetical protein
MKNYLLMMMAAALCCSAKAQVIAGLYSGNLRNDSTQKIQRYELALSEYRGKVFGYSYTTFIRNDSLFYSVKRVKGEKTGGKLVVEDEKMLANNFPEAAARGVRQVNIIDLTTEDTLRTMTGTWRTTQTKVYYPLTGGAEMARTTDSTQSPLINHLKDLHIVGDNYTGTVAKVKVKEDKVKVKATAASVPALVNLPYNQRRNNLLQSIEVTSDSVVLSVFDNGVIDGDSISIYQNEAMVFANQRLTEHALKKTVFLDRNSGEEVRILLVAESLGSIPPNTGLLIVQDGDKRYSLHFSADFQTNASILLRRKR